MEVHLKNRVKCKASEIEIGETFRLIEKQQCLEVIDLSQIDMFKDVETKLTLRDDVVYCVAIDTGVVQIIPKNIDVYKVNIVAEEKS